jgi:serine protease DegQ
MKRNVLLVATGMIIAIAVLAALRATAWPFKEGETPTLAPLLERVTPAVVNIAVVGSATETGNPLLNDPFFGRFFEGPDAPLAQPSVPRQSIGSGVIIDGAQGLVVTNHHVVQGADSIVVTLSDRREFNAMLVGSDAGTDVALLRVMADDAAFSELSIGDSSGLAVGDYVVAIGNPFGLGQTATAGIVSALGRHSGVNVESYEDFIQTDASINPGNSGGALVDINGRLLGVNTAILSGTGGNIGIGFAIPSNMVREVVEQLLEHGNVQRGRIGIAIQDVTPGLAQALELATDRGALVTQIEPGSSAEQAGIEPGDVIVAIDGQPIDNTAELRNEIGLTRAGGSVEVTTMRGGERNTVRATVAAETGAAGRARAADPASVSLLAGATIMELPADHPAYGRVRGVWVSAVAAGSAAARFGLRADDVITGVNREPITSVADLASALNEARPPIALQVQREGRSLFLLVR